MKPICRNAAVGTPAKQPIAVAADQPPETPELPVELEAWASILCSFLQQEVPVICQFGAFVQQDVSVCASESNLGRSLFMARSMPGSGWPRRGGDIMQVLLRFGCKRKRWPCFAFWRGEELVCL